LQKHGIEFRAVPVKMVMQAVGEPGQSLESV
jgi:hypothetical protein